MPLDHMGKINLIRYNQGMSPEKYAQVTTHTAIDTILICIFGFFILLQLFCCLKIIVSNFIEFQESWKLNMDFDDVLHVLSMPMIVINYWLWINTVFIKCRGFELPLASEEDFTFWADYAAEFRIMIKVSCVTLFLLFFKLTVSLQFSFPSFQLLFQYINKCK